MGGNGQNPPPYHQIRRERRYNDEENANERRPLLGNQPQVPNDARYEYVTHPILLGVLIIFVLPAVIVVALNLHDRFKQGTINSLTHRVSYLSKSLNTCENNSTQLANLLHEEQEQVEELKRQIRQGVVVQFLEVVERMGTGGDSWICSDKTRDWSYGYTSEQGPHPLVTVHTWTTYLNNGHHSRSPLVFPPTSLASLSPQPIESITQASSSSNETLETPETVLDEGGDKADSSDSRSIRIVGYSVTSLNTSGGNGWWRITKLPSFAIKGGSIEFWAVAARWARSSAVYEATVFWIEE